jgi:coiled-coil domain-containing protein 61
MLASAFSKDNPSVFIDLLTYSDLEVLKARKIGGHELSMSSTSIIGSNNVSNNNKLQQQQQQQLKRYAILTYSSEFDRVHYPLPLAFESTPNVKSMKKTIARLRNELKKKNEETDAPSNEKEKFLYLKKNTFHIYFVWLQYHCFF